MKDDSERLKQILSIGDILHSIQDIDLLLETVLSEARKGLNADAGSIYILNKDLLEIRYAQNETIEKKNKGKKSIYSYFSFKVSEKTISGFVAIHGQSLKIDDVYNIPQDAPYSYDTLYDKLSGYKTVSTLTIPLKGYKGKVLGVLQLINAKNAKHEIIPFSEDDLSFATHFANTASMALQRTSLTRTLLLRMIKMAELRDPSETGPHVNRVASYTVTLYEEWAKRQKIPSKEIESSKDYLRMGALLHDVGKVAISDLILKKPGSFSKEELKIMQAHTYLGARLFENKESELDEVASMIALTHHENWDGTGYPGHIDIATGKPLKMRPDGTAIGLKGEEIPLFGRLVAIADVYDALRSKRVYKKAWEESETLKEMKRLTGKKFDPQLMEVFFSIYEKIRTLADFYPDETTIASTS